MVAAKLSDELPSVERLQQALSFDLQAGKAYWKTSAGGQTVGAEVKYRHKSGYAYVQVDRMRFSLHRAIWAIANGFWPERTIDHIDGDTLNNAISNLRLASFAENCLNRKKYKNNQSGEVGVSRKHGKWAAQVNKGGKSHYLGLFDTKEAASAAYKAAATALHGEFSRHTQGDI